MAHCEHACAVQLLIWKDFLISWRNAPMPLHAPPLSNRHLSSAAHSAYTAWSCHCIHACLSSYMLYTKLASTAPLGRQCHASYDSHHRMHTCTALGRTPAHTLYCIQIYLATSPLRTDYQDCIYVLPNRPFHASGFTDYKSSLYCLCLRAAAQNNSWRMCVCGYRCGTRRLVMALRPAEGRKL